MKNIAYLLIFTAILTGGAGSASAEDRPWVVAFFANHGSWDSADISENSGQQNIGYTQLVYKQKKWGVSMSESYINSTYSTTQSDTEIEINSPSDLALATYYKIKLSAVNVRGGLDVSFPTGHNQFTQDEMTAIIIDDINEDLMLINNYGSGLNVRPHVLAVYENGDVTYGGGLSYLSSGPFDPVSDDGSSDEYDQGDKLSAYLSMMYKIRVTEFVLFTAKYSSWSADTYAGGDTFRNGDKYDLNIRWVHQWSDSLRAAVGFKYGTQAKNEVISDGDAFAVERSNANGNKTEIFVDGVYQLNRAFSPTLIVSYKKVDANGYSSGDSLYDGGRSSILFEPGVIIRFTPSAYATVKLAYRSQEDKKDAFSEKDAKYSIINFDVGLVLSF